MKLIERDVLKMNIAYGSGCIIKELTVWLMVCADFYL